MPPSLMTKAITSTGCHTADGAAQEAPLRGLLLPPEHALRARGQEAVPDVPAGPPGRAAPAAPALLRLPPGPPARPVRLRARRAPRRLDGPRGAPVGPGLLGDAARDPAAAEGVGQAVGEDRRQDHERRRARRPARCAGTAEFSTSSENSIDATPFGPNQAMKSLIGLGEPCPGQRHAARPPAARPAARTR